MNLFQSAPEMTTCNKNQVCKTKGYTKYTSWLPAFIIAILPKCPFCVMAYTGAVSMCSGKMLYPNAGSGSSYVLLGLSIIILLGIVLNYKDKRTWIAAAITIIGILLLYISQFYNISESLFYISVALLFFGIWFNGSFYYFYRKYINLVKQSFDTNLKSEL